MSDALAKKALEVALGEVGVREVDNTNWGPKVQEYLKAANVTVPAAWCFSGDVEILTAEGFVRFDRLPKGAPVATVSPSSLEVRFELPEEYIEVDFEGTLAQFQHRSLGMVCDARHRFFGYWWGAPGGDNELRPLQALGSGLSIPAVRTSVENDSPVWTDRAIQLLAVFLADGCIHDGRMSVQVSRAHKIELLRSLSPEKEYKAPRAYGRSKAALTTFEFSVADTAKVLAVMTEYKQPTFSVLAELSARQLALLVTTYSMLDGSAASKRAQTGSARLLYTASPYLRDWLQVAVTLAGWHSSYRETSPSPISGNAHYALAYDPSKETRSVTKKHVRFYEGKERLYCVQVSTGLIVVRDPKGTVLVVGNCAAYVNWSWEQAAKALGVESPLEKVPLQAYVQSYVDYGQKHGWVVPNREARAGDLFALWNTRLKRYAHIGVVTGRTPKGNIATVEGNTNSVGSREGYEVAKRTRTLVEKTILILRPQ